MEPKELTNIYAPNHAGNIKLYQRDESFYVSDDNATHCIKSHDIDKTLKKLAKLGVVEKFKSAGYIKINKHDGSYSLDAKVRGEGGGPILAALAYGVVKVGAYAGMVAMGVGAGAAITAATGGTAAAPIAAGVVVGAKAALGVTTGVAVAGTVVAGTSAGAALGTGTAALIATSGGIAGYLAAVESAALWAGAAGMACGPF
jgi:hypothetical protein